jgi:hypothetical protein
MLSVARVALAVALLVLTAACSSSGDDDQTAGTPAPTSATPTDSTPNAHVSAIQTRTKENTRKIALRTTNTGDGAFTIDAIHLVWPGMPEAAWTPKSSLFAPGQTIDLTMLYGDPDCSGYPAVPQEQPIAELRFAGADEPVTAEVDAKGVGWLHRLYRHECALAALYDVVDIELSGPWTRTQVAGEPQMRGYVELDRVGSQEPVTVTSVFGSILVRMVPADGGRPVATLAGNQPGLRIPVLLGSTNRCDDHGLSGATQNFLLSVFARHGTAPVQRIIVSPPPDVQSRVLDVVHDACRG